jgi:hypothetical protein
MPRFKVDIHGGDLEQARAALDAAGVPSMSIGPTYVGRGGEEMRLTDIPLHAIVDTLTPEQAEARVRDALPADGDFTVSSAEPFAPAEQGG